MYDEIVDNLGGYKGQQAGVYLLTGPDYGQFAICFKGSKVQPPAGAMRIDLPVKYSRVLARVELGFDWDKAVDLQHQFTFKVSGNPTLHEIPKTPGFDLEHLPGVEAFDAAENAMNSEDTNPGMEKLQAKVSDCQRH